LLQVSGTYVEEGIKEARESRETCKSYQKALRFYAELYVARSPSEVWSFFSDLTKWRQWSPICHGCRLDDDQGELRQGSILEMGFAVAGITLTVPCLVVQFDPPGSITWQSQKFGIQATHSYRFIPRYEGTMLCNEETFTGVGFPLNELMIAWYRASKLSEESLQGIRRELLRTTALRQ